MLWFQEKLKSNIQVIFLIFILLISAYFAYLPHASYKYPLHRDEWDRITIANQFLKYKSMEFPDPFDDEGTIKNHPEIGFIIFISIFKLIGIDWWAFFRFSPVIFSIILTYTAFVLGRRLGYGIEAAFFVAILPTTVRFLGPAFFVPVSLALPFILLISYFAFYFEKRKYVLIYLASVFLLYEHPPSAIAVFVSLLILIVKEKDLKLLATISVASLTAIPQFISYIEPRGAEGLVFTAVGLFQSIPKEFGYLPTAVFVLGFYLAMKELRREEIVISISVAVFFFLIVVYRFFEYIPLIWPERVLLYSFLFMSLIAGRGLNWIRRKQWMIALGLSVIILMFSYQSHVSTPYYHIINDKDFEDYAFIRDNLDGKAIMDPWKAIAFTAVAEKPVYVRIPAGPSEKFNERLKDASTFFSGSCSDTNFLIKNNISIVYYKGNVKNLYLIEVRKNIYYLSLK